MNIRLTKIPVKYIVQGFKNYILDKISDIKHKYEFNARYNICMNCDKRTGNLCSVCGCFIKVKTKSEGSKCPDDKWLEIKD